MLNAMKRCAVTALALFSTIVSVSADDWVLSERRVLNELRELGGVPNYDQRSFPGDNDCGPTAIAMALGYWDGHGWPALVQGGGPYYGAGGPSAGLLDLDRQLKAELPYTDTFGTVDWTFFVPWVSGDIGARTCRVAARQDAGASAWGNYDDESVSRDDVRQELRAGRPMVLCTEWTSFEYHWDTRSGTEGSVRFHFMTVLGFEDWHIDDWFTSDQFWVALRSGWRSGGDSVLWYNWSFWDDLYEVMLFPSGAPARPRQTCLLWNGPSGAATVWGLDNNGRYCGASNLPAYAGWTATCYETLGTGGAALLRSDAYGWAMLEILDANDRVLAGQTRYYQGPPEGGTPVSYRRLANGTGRMLWSRTDGTAELWQLDAAGNRVSRVTYANPGRRAVCYDKLPDGKGRLLWEDGAGVSELWTLHQNELREIDRFSYVSRTYSGRLWFDGALRMVGYRDLGDGTRRVLEVSPRGTWITRLNPGDDMVSTQFHGWFDGWTPRSVSGE